MKYTIKFTSHSLNIHVQFGQVPVSFSYLFCLCMFQFILNEGKNKVIQSSVKTKQNKYIMLWFRSFIRFKTVKIQEKEDSMYIFFIHLLFLFA